LTALNAPALDIRPATAADLGRIFEIYNHEVEHEMTTFDTEPRVLGRDDGWLLERPDRYPVLVGELGGEVIGWSSLSQWSPRGAYARTAEVSVYVDRAHRGHGYGKALLAAAIEIAPGTGAGVLLARISDSNPASIGVHRSLGFELIGTQRRAGEKFGRILDVSLMDLHVDGT
jgi:phosphinothricin acetyltransferase